MTLEPYLTRMKTSQVYDICQETPLQFADLLSEQLNRSIYFKREDCQPIHSFKIRGAHQKISQLTLSEKRRGVIAASAGNHAQGVALASLKLGVKATIVMPKTTPAIKLASVRRRGANIILHGNHFQAAAEHAASLANRHGLSMVHPFDDPAVITGQGTIGLEILRQINRKPGAILVPVGGGGLIAGIAVAVKLMSPATQIIGVQAQGAHAMTRSLCAGKLTHLPNVDRFADGTAVSRVGRETFRIVRKLVDRMIIVRPETICCAIRQIFEETRVMVEPSGALATAGLLAMANQVRTFAGPVISIISGANVDYSAIGPIIARTPSACAQAPSIYADTWQNGQPWFANDFIGKKQRTRNAE